MKAALSTQSPQTIYKSSRAQARCPRPRPQEGRDEPGRWGPRAISSEPRACFTPFGPPLHPHPGRCPSSFTNTKTRQLWWHLSTEKKAQHESCELNLTWGKMRTIAWETVSQIPLRNRWKERGRGGAQYICDLGEGRYVQSATLLGRELLLVTRSRCLH